MKILRLLVGSLVALTASQCAFATSFAWMSAEAFLEQSDLIAVVEIASVHEVTTPEGFRLQSAKATIVDEIFRRFSAAHEREPKSILIYSLDPNAAVSEENLSGNGFAFPIREGKALVCLKMEGINKFYPYGPLCFQSLNASDEVMWPSEGVYRVGMDPYSKTPLSIVVDQLKRLQTE